MSNFNWGEGVGGLASGLFGLMKDDKGVFQGGEKGRVFGRLKDSLDRHKQNRMKDKYNLQSDAEAEVVANADKGQRQAIASNYEKSDQMYKQTLENSKNLLNLRQMSKELDVSDPEAVKQWQERAGLKVDGMFGPKSLQAMRDIQGDKGAYSKEGYLGDYVPDWMKMRAEVPLQKMNEPSTWMTQSVDRIDADTIPEEEIAKFNENQAGNASRSGYGFPTF